MPDHLDPAAAALPHDYAAPETPDERGALRLLSRSPHPYHRHQSEILHSSDGLASNAASIRPAPLDNPRAQLYAASSFSKESTPGSDSGTEADDEHFLKGLPAPKFKLHKGLRGWNEQLSGTSTPLALLEEDVRRLSQDSKRPIPDLKRRINAEAGRRRKELVRRGTEVLLLIALGGTLCSNANVKPIVWAWRRELLCELQVVAALLLLYSIRLVLWAKRQGNSFKKLPLSVPASFDPAPILYPLVIPLFVSFLIAASDAAAVLPNLILSICSIPKPLIPAARSHEIYSTIHWLLSSLPLLRFWGKAEDDPSGLDRSGIPHETLVLLYPLHQSLCFTLHHLTTTSLLPAELQLLAISLINLVLLARSPQAIILKALLWGGGLALLLLCGPVIRWAIALARVPKWRFRRPSPSATSFSIGTILNLMSALKSKPGFHGSSLDEDSALETPDGSDDGEQERLSAPSSPRSPHRSVEVKGGGIEPIESVPVSSSENKQNTTFSEAYEGAGKTHARRQTLPHADHLVHRSTKTHTPSGRRKRSASSTVRAFFSLTQGQAMARKWLYAGYVYICILAIILLGVRDYVGRYALRGEEPVGWALGYLFGDLPSFRFEVVKANFEWWICLPPRSGDEHMESCSLGWVQHLRHTSFGEANTRLILGAYFVAILVMGLAVVFKLSPVYEVDTRRKVFHFMMVAMFLPATYVDPTYAALALSLILAVFLLLDLLRASQLPPLSKPIAAFLTPYVDGRDLRGPVVISHIFLLIGCAIPLWLSLGSLPRTGSGYLEGWEIPIREVSMVAGVVCVGLGDAAASLIGRRWGRRKWLWGGGKSLEGSVAFATAVFVGLMTAHVWLRLGGWPVTGEEPSVSAAHGRFNLHLPNFAKTARDAGYCASMASLTEAVLTGGNDNVVVPVVLWTCVKSLGL